MSKTSYINIRTDLELKQKSEAILSKLGLTKTDAINIFLRQVVLNNGLPFEVKIPKKALKKSIDDLENNKNLYKTNKASDLLKGI